MKSVGAAYIMCRLCYAYMVEEVYKLIVTSHQCSRPISIMALTDSCKILTYQAYQFSSTYRVRYIMAGPRADTRREKRNFYCCGCVIFAHE